MSDLISRQAMFDGIDKLIKIHFDRTVVLYKARKVAEDLPSVQPERKTGRWIKVNGKTAINCSACYQCSWSLIFEDTVKRFNFCPNCGADMRGEQE